METPELQEISYLHKTEATHWHLIQVWILGRLCSLSPIRTKAWIICSLDENHFSLQWSWSINADQELHMRIITFTYGKHNMGGINEIWHHIHSMGLMCKPFVKAQMCINIQHFSVTYCVHPAHSWLHKVKQGVSFHFFFKSQSFMT